MLGAFGGFLFIILFVGIAGRDAAADITMPHEEWISAELSSTANANQTRTASLHRGDNAISALVRLGFKLNTSHAIIHAANAAYKLKNIRAGQIMKRMDSDKGIDIYYNINDAERLHIQQQHHQTSWHAGVEKRQVYARQHIASGTIHGSLFGAAEQAGIDHRTAMNLVKIFAWDIDFSRDLHRGDSFRLVYEERFDDQGRMLESSILAAEFVVGGKQFQAVRYQQTNGDINYFTPSGNSMRKVYLKAPVKFSRISSRFTLRRKHPVLGYTRAHRGVDYASPRGTPVHAIGDGSVRFAGWKGGFGRFILIRHNNHNHSTAYAHLSRYARGIKRGVHVKQGQIIGYVGMSGLATGPHLHFEFRVNNRAVNPLTVKYPPARPIARAERNRFKQQTAPQLSRLNQLQAQLSWS